MESLKLEEVELLCLLFDEYSKNSVFQINEYADVSKIHTKLQSVVADKSGSSLAGIELAEIIYLVKMLQVSSTRYKTPIQNWERILNVYKSLIKVAQSLENANKLDSVAEETSIEELSNLSVSGLPE